MVAFLHTQIKMVVSIQERWGKFPETIQHRAKITEFLWVSQNVYENFSSEKVLEIFNYWWDVKTDKQVQRAGWAQFQDFYGGKKTPPRQTIINIYHQLM